MYRLNVTSFFAGAHKLDNYPGACKNLHGHNWKIRVQLTTQELDDLGMAIDFKIVKDRLNELIEKFDHQYLNDLEWFENQNTTSENIARVIYHELQKSLDCFMPRKDRGIDKNIKVSEVEVWESDMTSIVYCEK